MGWHDILHGRIMKLWEDPQHGADLKWPGQPALMEQGGTVNFWAMAIAGEYGRANRYGTDAEKRYINDRVRNEYFPRQREAHMSRGNAIEQTCCDPHYNFHATPAAFIRLCALEFGHADILGMSDEWWRAHVALYRTCLHPDGEVFIPGMRAKGLPLTQVGTAIMREILGLPHQKPIKAKNPNDFFESPQNKTYFAAARMVRALLAKGDRLGDAKSAKATPKLALPMTVTRYEGGHIATLDNPKGYKLLEPVNALAVLYSRPQKHSGPGGATIGWEFEMNFSKDEGYEAFVRDNFGSRKVIDRLVIG